MPEFSVVQRDDEHLVNLRVRGDNALERFRLDPFSAAKEEVIHAAEDRQTAVMPFAAIACGKPSLRVGQRNQFAIAPVA